MTDDSTVLERIEEPELPDERPNTRPSRRKPNPVPRSGRNTGFNQPWKKGAREAAEVSAVRQPPILPAFQKPLKPIGKESIK